MRKLLSLVITPFDAIAKHIPLIIKQIIVAVCFFFICFNRVIGDNLIWNNSFAITVGLGIVLSLIIIVLMLDKETINSVKIKPLFLICLEVVGISFLLNGIYYRVVGYIAIFVIFSLVIPLFSLTISKHGNNIIIPAAIGVVAFFALFLAVAFFKGSPIIVGISFGSFLANPNWLGMFLNTVVMSILILMFNSKNYAVKTLLIIAYAISFWLCKATNSTTTIIAVSAMTVIFILLEILHQFKVNGKKAFARITITVVIALVIIPVAKLAVPYVYSDLKNDYAEKQSEKSVAVAVEAMPAETLEEATTSTVEELPEGVSKYGAEYEIDTTEVAPWLQALNNKFSGRIGIWETFLSKMEFIGHKNEMRVFKYGENDTIAFNAHNAFVQVPYSAGIIAGIAYITFVVGSAFLLLFKKFSLEKLALFIICAGFVLCSMGEASYLPYIYLPATFYFMFVGKVITKETK